MKIILILFASLLMLSAQADGGNWVQNGDFTDGILHWRGNGRSPADMSSTNPFDKPDPALSKGLIIPLRHADWDKVAQDFHGKSATGVLTITFVVAPDVKFSTKPEDYVDMPAQLHYDGWKPVTTPQGAWVVFVADFGSSHGEYWTIKPKLGSAEPQVFRAKVERLTPLEDKTITLGFPPGDGNIVVLSVAMTDN